MKIIEQKIMGFYRLFVLKKVLETYGQLEEFSRA